MATKSWNTLLLSWANVLRICDQELNCIDEFVTSDFFPLFASKLLGEQSRIRNIESAFNYLKQFYPSVDLDTFYLSENDLITAATLFLVHCSLNHVPRDPELQNKLYSLSDSQQCLLKSLLERFMLLEKSSITKEKILTEIGQIGRNISATSSPAGLQTTPLCGISHMKLNNSSSHSSKKASKVRRLRSQIDFLTSVQQELQDELEETNKKINQFHDIVAAKDSEIARLKMEFINASQSMDSNMTADEPYYSASLCKQCVYLKKKVENLERDCSAFQEELALAIASKDSKDTIQKEQVANYEIQLKQSLEREDLLKLEIGELRLVINDLKATNQEQLEYLNELKQKSSDVSVNSLPDLLIPEDLGSQVVDIQLQELRESVKDKDKEITDLRGNIESIKKDLNKSHTLISERDNTIQIISDQKLTLTAEMKALKNELMKLEEDLKRVNDEKCIYENSLAKLKEVMEKNLSDMATSELLKDQLSNKLEETIDELNRVIEEKDLCKNELNEKCFEICKLTDTIEKSDLSMLGLKNEIQDLTLSIESICKENASIIEKNDNLHKDNNLLKEKLNSIEKQNNEKKVLLEKVTEENLKLTTDMNELRELLSEVNSEKDSLSVKNQSLIEQANDYTLTISDYFEQIDKLKSLNTIMEKNLQGVNREKITLIDKITSLDNQIVAKMNEIKSQRDSIIFLTDENLKLNNEVFDLNQALKDKSATEIINQNEISLLKAELFQATKDCENKESALQQLIFKENTLQNHLIQLHQKIIELSLEHENVLSSSEEIFNNYIHPDQSSEQIDVDVENCVGLENAKTAAVGVQNQFENNISSCNQASSNKIFTALTDKLDHCNKTLNYFVQTLKNKEQMISALNDEKNILLQTIENKDAKLIQLSLEVEDKTASGKVLLEEKKELSANILNLEKEKACALSINADLNQKIDVLKKKMENLELVLKQKENLMIDHVNEKKTLLENLEELKKKCFDKDKELGSKLDRVCLLEEENINLKNKINTLEGELIDTSIQTSKLEANNSILKNKYDVLMNTHDQKLTLISRKDELINALKTEKNDLENKIQYLEKEEKHLLGLNEKRELEITVLTNEKIELIKDLESLNIDLHVSNELIENSKLETNTLLQQLEDKTNELSNKLSIINDLNVEKFSLSNKLEQLNAEITLLKDNNENKMQTIVFMTEQKEALEGIIEMLKYNMEEQLRNWDRQHKMENETFEMKVKRDLEHIKLNFNDKEMELKNIFNMVEERSNLFIELSDKLCEVRNYSDDLLQKFKTLEREHKELSKEVISLKDEIIKMNEKEENLKSNISTLNNDIFLKNRDLKSKTFEIKSLKDSKNKIFEELSLLKNDIESLEKTRDLLNATNIGLVQEINKTKTDLIKALNEESAALAKISNTKPEVLEDADLNINMISEHFKIHFKKFRDVLIDQTNKIEELQAYTNIPTLDLSYEKELKNLRSTFNEYRQKSEEEMARLVQELEMFKEKYVSAKLRINEIGSNAEELEKSIRTEYELKLNRLKMKMKQTYKEKLEDLLSTDEVKELQEQLKYERGKVMCLEKRLSEYSDKLLITQEENRRLLSETFAKPAPVAFSSASMKNSSQASLSLTPVMKSHSAEILTGRNNGIDNLGQDFSPDERRSSIRSLPRGIGRVFPAAEEAGEVFDDRCLADLKAGIVHLPGPDPCADRMSTLQLRNSLCPPHLKSSYPVETQFFKPCDFKEDDIKSGGLALNNGVLETNIPEDKRKFKIQISYRKPTPPSAKKAATQKVGGVLKEQNRTSQKLSTPSRIKALFGYKPKDENSPVSRNRSSKR